MTGSSRKIVPQDCRDGYQMNIFGGLLGIGETQISLETAFQVREARPG